MTTRSPVKAEPSGPTTRLPAMHHPSRLRRAVTGLLLPIVLLAACGSPAQRPVASAGTIAPLPVSEKGNEVALYALGLIDTGSQTVSRTLGVPAYLGDVLQATLLLVTLAMLLLQSRAYVAAVVMSFLAVVPPRESPRTLTRPAS